MTVCEWWSGRDSGERTQQEALAHRTGASSRGRSVGRWVSGGRLPPPSGREWQGAQSGQGTIELGFPRPALWQMQCEAARRAGDPSGQGEEPPPEGLGGHHLLAQTDARCPAGHVVGHHLYRQPGAVGGEAARGEMVQPHTVLEVSDRILDLGVAAMVGLQFEHLPVPVGDEAVIAVGGEEEAPEWAEPSEPFVLGELAVDYAERRVTLAGRPVQLTAIEYGLLFELSVNAGRVLTYDRLRRRVWGLRRSGDSRRVRTAAKQLRRKLGDDANNPTYILNEPSVGYRMAKGDAPGPETGP